MIIVDLDEYSTKWPLMADRGWRYTLGTVRDGDKSASVRFEHRDDKGKLVVHGFFDANIPERDVPVDIPEIAQAEFIRAAQRSIRDMHDDAERRHRDYLRSRERAASETPENMGNRRSIAVLRERGYTEYEMRRSGMAKVDGDGSLRITEHGHVMAGAYPWYKCPPGGGASS